MAQLWPGGLLFGNRYSFCQNFSRNACKKRKRSSACFHVVLQCLFLDGRERAGCSGSLPLTPCRQGQRWRLRTSDHGGPSRSAEAQRVPGGYGPGMEERADRAGVRLRRNEKIHCRQTLNSVGTFSSLSHLIRPDQWVKGSGPIQSLVVGTQQAEAHRPRRSPSHREHRHEV